MKTIKALEKTLKNGGIEMKKLLLMDLQIFDGGAGEGSSSSGGNSNQNAGDNANKNSGGTFSYEQLNEIATARAERAEKAALKSFFTQQGLSEDEATKALEKYKADKKASQPDVSAVERERDAALAELESMKNQQLLTSKGVKAEDVDYVLFKVKQLVDDKTDFSKAAEKFLKENPRFTNSNSYKVTSSSGNQNNGTSGNAHDSINNALRMAIRR